ncbi:MAG: VanZ family protein [Candidatus Omnitrophica bacterium]|nr:VanZ family protein [Candidatus Omnitrophota bacterium]MDD5238171.1 VanZ family protein [Candidatus Omnitrophota bacterium]
MPVLFVMVIIFYASSIPGKDIPLVFSFQDIVFHFFIYFLLAWSFSRALKKTYSDIAVLKVIFFTLVFGVIYAISDEWHQSFVPHRNVSASDVLVDGMGSLMGGLIYGFRNDKNKAV